MTQTLRIASFNIRGYNAKREILEQLLEQENLDIIAIQETLLRKMQN